LILRDSNPEFRFLCTTRRQGTPAELRADTEELLSTSPTHLCQCVHTGEEKNIWVQHLNHVLTNEPNEKYRFLPFQKSEHFVITK
jgi:hypothetical protein